MAMNDTLARAMNDILNAERIGREHCVVSPVSKVTKAVLQIMQDKKYIGEFEIIDDGKGGQIKVQLIGGINKCGVIKPRFSVTLDTYEKFEKRYLPAKGFGFIVVSTSQGIMTQDEAKEKNVGGKLLAYVY